MQRAGLLLVWVLSLSIALSLALHGVDAAAAAGLVPGDIVVADQFRPAIIRVDPTTGNQTILTSGNLLGVPRGLAIDANGNVLVAVRYGQINGIIRVDPTIPDGLPGNLTVVSSGGSFVAPADLLVIGASGDIVVADFFGGVIRVNPVTGVQTVVSSGGNFTAISGIALEPDGDILVSDSDAFSVGPGEVIRVNPVTGAQTVVSSGGSFLNPAGMAIDANGHIFVANQGPYPGGVNQIVRVDPVTGTQTVVFSSSSILPGAIAIDSNGDILVADFYDGVIKVDPATGIPTPVSSGGFFIQPAGIECVSAPPSPCSVAMEVSFNPHTLNLGSNGKWVTVYLEPPSGHSASDIDVSSILLNGSVAVASGAPTAIGDHDQDSVPDLAVKFSRSALRGILPSGDAVAVSVRGLIAHECFEGTDVIRVRNSVLASPVAGSVLTPGSEVDVRWSPDSPALVDLISSFDDGLTWNIEARGLPNTGTHSWTVPPVTSGRARLGVVVIRSVGKDGIVAATELGESGMFSIQQVTGVDNGSLTFAMGEISPNPTRREFTVSFSLPTGKPATLAVFDVSGRQVAGHDVGRVGAGQQSVTFGKRETLPPGVYLVRLTQDGLSLTARAVIIQ